MNTNPLTDVYEKLCSYENLELAFSKARRGKTLKKYVIDFEKDLEKNLSTLRSELLMQIYQPLPLKTFILKDPKTRIISKSDFRDRVIHHAVCNIIEPTFDKTFIHDSYANRIGKGTLNAIKRFDIFKKKASKNNTINCYVLKADIKHYFETVNHQILLTILQRKIKDDRVIWLIKKILANHKTKKVGHGMPLGNLTSQFFANVYLNGLDQFVKHKLRAKYYIRYVDDFIIMDTSKRILQNNKVRINDYLKKYLELELHPEKSRIITLDRGINFLGFRIFYHHKLLTKKNMKRFEKNLEEMKQLYTKDKIDREKVIEKFEGWLAYTTHANTYKYRKRITSKFNQDFPPKLKVKVSSVKKHENFNNKIYTSKLEFTQKKTLRLLKKGQSIKQIAEQRRL
ncbi:MAG: reverse transcriptase domain-containing protein, partial [Nanoarchaeota archaeon]